MDPWEVKISSVAIKAIDLPESMKLAIAKQAAAKATGEHAVAIHFAHRVAGSAYFLFPQHGEQGRRGHAPGSNEVTLPDALDPEMLGKDALDVLG